MTMVEQQYLAQGLAHSDDLSGAASLSDGVPTTSAAQQPSAYPDLTPYGTVSTSPFNLSAQCDPNLLTPISAAGSPPLHQGRKLVRQYPPPPTTPGAQQPTPPGSSKMYPQQWTQFDMNGQSSQTSSPMAPQGQVAQDYMENPYIQDGRRTPGPPEPYMGAFGVSDGPEPHSMNHPYYMQMPPPMEGQPSQMMPRDGHPMHLGVHHRDMPNAPLLNEPHPSHFRARQPTPEEHQGLGLPNGSRSGNGSPRRRASSNSGAGRVSKKRSTKSRSGQPRPSVADDPLEEHKNCFGQEVPPALKANCPEEERCIFESRWQHRHQKGQDMWESIQNDFKNRFHKCPGKEMLQMKFKRGRSKYIEWIPRDEDLLREAWIRVEKARYQMILETFVELGGSRNMRLNPSDIEIKVVNDLKLEEGLYMEAHPNANIRRRHKTTSARKRTNTRGGDDEMPLSDEMMSVSSHNTLEDDVINQVHGRQDYKMDDDSSTGGNDMMDMQMWEQPIKIESGVMPQRTEGMPQMMRLSPAAAAAASYGRHR